jgi:hypothetical protein
MFYSYHQKPFFHGLWQESAIQHVLHEGINLQIICKLFLILRTSPTPKYSTSSLVLFFTRFLESKNLMSHVIYHL